METKIELKDIFKISDGVRARNEEFGLLIVSKTTPAMSVNADGKFVWELIDGTNSVEDIINNVKKEYEESSLEDNVYAIIGGFLKLNLIRIVK